MSEREILEKIKTLRLKTVKTEEISKEEELEKEICKTEWTVFWRKNINLYISKKLHINTYPFQHRSFYLMQDSTMYEEIATRGVSKSYRMATFGVAECMLYPYSKIVITANTFQQACSIVEEKLERELFSKETLSPVLCYLYKNGYIKIDKKDNQLEVNFLFNHSVMTLVPCLDSARRLRATVLMFEECRLMKKSMIDSIFENMLQPRTAEFLALPEYQGKDEYIEDVKSIYVTSNRFKSEWFYTLFKKTFVGYFNEKLNRNRVFVADIYTALKYGLKTKRWYLNAKAKMNELDFRMEVLNEALGEADGAYFTMEMFQKNQIIKRAFSPPDTEQFINNSLHNRNKQPDEIRIVFVDFAFSSTTPGSTANDNTVIGCLSILKNNEQWKRQVEYVETHGGSENDFSLQRIREIFFDYHADFIVYDNLNGGTVNYNSLTKEYPHPQRPNNLWNSHGFTIAIDNDYQMMAEGKLDDLKRRTVDPNALPVMIPISANPDWNSNMWMDLSQRLRNSEISFLIDDLDFQQSLEQSKNYFKLTSEEKATMRLPYIQTMYLINEAINLTQEWREGKLKLSEPNTGTKDRVVALAYANLIATKIINKLERNEQTSGFNAEDWNNCSFV